MIILTVIYFNISRTIEDIRRKREDKYRKISGGVPLKDLSQKLLVPYISLLGMDQSIRFFYRDCGNTFCCDSESGDGFCWDYSSGE